MSDELGVQLEALRKVYKNSDYVKAAVHPENNSGDTQELRTARDESSNAAKTLLHDYRVHGPADHPLNSIGRGLRDYRERVAKGRDVWSSVSSETSDGSLE